MARLSYVPRTRRSNQRHGELFRRAALSLSFIAALSFCAAGQDQGPTALSTPQSGGNDTKPSATKGETVFELDDAIWYVFQAKDDAYWFGSNEQGVYRYVGKTLVRFTTRDGLASNQIRGIQEDEAGTVYVTTYAGISAFDGRGFTLLSVTDATGPTDWKLQPDDVWFVGAPDTGTVLRYDGKSLHRLAFPRTKAGDDATLPRSEYPNAKYSPYDVYTIFEDSQGNLWFGTACLGVCRYDGKSFTWLPDSELNNGSFGARSVIEDKQGKFWFGDSLHRFAVDVSDPSRVSFRKEEGLLEPKDPTKPRIDGILSSTVDKTGALWLASYGGGVLRYDGKDATHFPVQNDGKDITVFNIHEDNQGVLWLGTHSWGAYKFNGVSFERFRP